MSDFGGNNEADSKLRQHCIALEAEVLRLQGALKLINTPGPGGEYRSAKEIQRIIHQELVDRAALAASEPSTPK